MARHDALPLSSLPGNFQLELPAELAPVEASEVIQAVVLFGLANLIASIVMRNTTVEAEGNLSHALFLCRLCALLPGHTESPSGVFQMRRSMFWSGVIIPQAVDPSGMI
jgi:hypothetical protein